MAASQPRITISPPEPPIGRPILATSPSPSPGKRLSVQTPQSLSNQEVTDDGSAAYENDEGLKWIPRNGDHARAKSGKDKAGWGNLPVNILHNVLSYAQIDVALDHTLGIIFGQQARSREVVLALAQRIWFCRLRTVCSDWRNAVDSHAFWPEYTLLIDPSRYHSSTITDFHSARLTPSTPSFPTLFHRARFNTLTTCLACRLNHPSRIGLYPAIRKRLTHTAKFGLAPTCEKHAGSFCSNCMRESELQPARNSIGGYGGNIIHAGTPSPRDQYIPTLMLSVCNQGDVDEQFTPRAPRSLVCPDCRKMAIWSHIVQILRECARGGRTRGERGPWLANEKFKDYVDFNVGTASDMASAAVEDQWLIDHTRWNELFDTALQLQNHEKSLKLQFFRTAEEEMPHQRKVRLARLAELRGEDLDSSDLEEDTLEMESMYRGWWKELEDEDVDSDDDEEDDELLNDRYRVKLRAGCINDFINDRIRYAFWVLPSDEVHKLVYDERLPTPDRSGAIHTTFPDIAKNAVHPYQDQVPFDFTPLDACADAAGLISLRATPPVMSVGNRLDPFLPPERLLRSLDKKFTENLAQRTSSAMESLMKVARDRCDGDDGKAEQLCENMRLEDLLTQLLLWQLWVPVALVQGKQLAEMQGELDQSGADLSSGLGNELDAEGELETSPRIELVEDDGSQSEFNFAPVEVPASDELFPSPDTESSVSLGKRKSLSGSQSPSSAEKRARSSSPRPQTPAAQISPVAGTLGLSLDAAVGQGIKRKEPPSPNARHIDTSLKSVTPPPAPKFDHIDHKRTRVEMLGRLDGHASSAPGSLPSSPTPIKQPVDDDDHDDRGDRGTSATDTAGTVLVTPEEGLGIGEGIFDVDYLEAQKLKVPTPHANASEASLQSEASVASEEEEPVPGPLTPVDTVDAPTPTASSVSTATSLASVPSTLADPALSPVTIANQRLIKYMHRTEQSVPFVPLSSVQMVPLGGDGDDEGSAIVAPLNLGQGANRALMQAWYDARGELRECKCRICERARRKAWECLEVVRQSVAGDEIGWEALLS